MKGWRFYEEYETNKRKVSIGSVVAVDSVRGIYPILSFGTETVYQYDCASALFGGHNPPVCGGAVNAEYVQRRCKRISEAKARTIHPKLFEYLEVEQ